MKVLYISGYTDNFIAGHGMLGPGSHLLNKPFTEEALIRKVCEVLDGGEPGKVERRSELVLSGSSARHKE